MSLPPEISANRNGSVLVQKDFQFGEWSLLYYPESKSQLPTEVEIERLPDATSPDNAAPGERPRE